jgi:hypothetical protein
MPESFVYFAPKWMYMTDVDIKGGSYLLTVQVLTKAHRIKFKLFDKT